MPNEVEIDRPLPGDALGQAVEVGGTYSCQARGPITIRVSFLKADGTPAVKLDGTDVPPKDTGNLPAGADMPWSVTFDLDDTYTDHQFRAELRSGGATLDTDAVDDIGVHPIAIAQITFTLS